MGYHRPDELNPTVVAVRTAMASMTAGSGNELAGVGQWFDWPSACLGNNVGDEGVLCSSAVIRTEITKCGYRFSINARKPKRDAFAYCLKVFSPELLRC